MLLEHQRRKHAGLGEYLEFTANENNGDVTFSTSWTVDQNLALNESRSHNAVLSLGSSLVVARGYSASGSLKSVEVLDTADSVVWSLPIMIKERKGCSVVATSTGIVAIGGYEVDSCETLPLITKKQELKVRCTVIYMLIISFCILTS